MDIVSVKFMDKLLFTRHLAVMIKSGVPIAEAVSIIRDQSTNSTFRRILKGVSADIDNGQTLEKAISKYPKVFDSFYVNMIKIGEKSGTLEENLAYLATSLKKDYDFRQKVTASSLYPSVILATAVIVGGGISIFVLPKMIDLFKSFEVDLPTSTKILLWLAGIMQQYGILIFGSIIGFLILFRILLFNRGVRYLWEKLLLGFPTIGTFVTNVQMTFFTRNLGMMLKSGMAISESLDSLYASTGNLVFKNYIHSFASSIQKGESLTETIKKGRFSHIPKIAAKMIEIGEKTGKLDESLLYLGDYFEDETDNAAQNFSSILEPILLLAVGVVVAFVAMAIISPIYQYTSVVGK